MTHLKDIKSWLAMVKNLKTFVLPNNPGFFPTSFGKLNQELQDRFNRTERRLKDWIREAWRGREEIKLPEFVLIALGKFSQRYSEIIKQDVKLALEE
jgi:hypothetical protein